MILYSLKNLNLLLVFFVSGYKCLLWFGGIVFFINGLIYVFFFFRWRFDLNIVDYESLIGICKYFFYFYLMLIYLMLINVLI